jgi:hypothetical protein
MGTILLLFEENVILPVIYGFVVGAHLIFGILVPALWLFFRSRGQVKYDQKLRSTVSAWIFTSWGLFFGFNSFCVLLVAINSGGWGVLVGLLFGTGIFGMLAGLAFWQARIQWQNR